MISAEGSNNRSALELNGNSTNARALISFLNLGTEKGYIESRGDDLNIIPNGNVGIGLSAPDNKLHVSFADATAVTGANIDNNTVSGIHIACTGNDTNAGGMLKFSSRATNVVSAIAHQQMGTNTSDLVFFTGVSDGSPTEKMRILAAGGVTFNGDTAAANALDDYEEGNWTPALLYQNASGVSLDYATDGFQIGRYTKIGNVVHCRFSIQVDITGSPVNDNISIQGFPFTSLTVTNMEGAGVADQLMITGKANYALQMSMNSTTAGMILSSITGNQGDEIGVGANKRFNGGITYLAG